MTFRLGTARLRSQPSPWAGRLPGGLLTAVLLVVGEPAARALALPVATEEALPSGASEAGSFITVPVGQGGRAGQLRATFEPATGLPAQLETRLGDSQRQWLQGSATLQARKETTGAAAAPAHGSAIREGAVLARLDPLGLTMNSRWSREGAWLVWDLDFAGQGPRSGHEVTLDLPVLAPTLRLFTPSDRGVVDLSLLPSHRPVPYGFNGWGAASGQTAYVLPLASVFDVGKDCALTVALPPDQNIPHLQVEWVEARVLRFTLGHRGMGGGRPSPLRLLFTTHQADYRSVLAAYASQFPAYFEPALPPNRYDGSFYYHHIQAHPDFLEMERQNVRYIWSSFWFTHLGNYLPDEPDWYPYTYAKWWNLRETMNDGRINAFIDEMLRHQVGTYAYFNVTEYGGSGGQSGEPAEANRLLRERFADALIRDASSNAIPTWEGAMAMNPGLGHSLWPQLKEQVERHLRRLPDCQGFVIDRLDWASTLDYGHDDGLSMVGDRPVENLAGPVAAAVREVCRLSHAAGRRVLVNQFWKVEVLRDVNGSCHESDYLAQRYLIPFRPAAAWRQATKPYDTRNLAPFEAQLKQRLQIALLPQMIAHRFPISQQPPAEAAADLQELFTPLFKVLAGRRQVLRPHCVAATGANNVNLFTDPQGRYLVPVTSRIRFLSRGDREVTAVEVTISLPEASALTWAHAIPLGDKPYRAEIWSRPGQARLTLPRHSAATMLVVGSGTEPALEDGETARLAVVRDARFPRRSNTAPTAASAPAGAVTKARLRLAGTNFNHPGPFRVLVDGVSVGTLEGSYGSFPCTVEHLAKPEVTLLAADEGAWYLPDCAQLFVETAEGTTATAVWEPGDDVRSSLPSPSLPLHSSTPSQSSHPSQEAAAAPQAAAVSQPAAEPRAGRALSALVLPLRWSLKPVLPTTGVFIDR